MTVQELIEELKKQNPNEKVYIWGGNWPNEHYTSNIKLDRPYGSVSDDYGNTIEDPLMLY